MRHSNPHGRATAPHPPHMAAQGVMGERTGPNAKLDDRGALKGALPGTACSVPGKEADPRRGRGFQHFRGRFPPGDFCVSPVLGFQTYGRRFFGDGTFSSPRGYFSYLRVLCPSGRAPSYVHTSPWFEPRLSNFSCFFHLFVRHSAQLFFLCFAAFQHYLLPPGIFFCVPVFISFSTAMGVPPGLCFARITMGVAVLQSNTYHTYSGTI